MLVLKVLGVWGFWGGGDSIGPNQTSHGWCVWNTDEASRYYVNLSNFIIQSHPDEEEMRLSILSNNRFLKKKKKKMLGKKKQDLMRLEACFENLLGIIIIVV